MRPTAYYFRFEVKDAADIKRKIAAFEELTGEKPKVFIEGDYTDADDWYNYFCDSLDRYEVIKVRGSKITVKGQRDGKVMTFDPSYRCRRTHNKCEFIVRSEYQDW